MASILKPKAKECLDSSVKHELFASHTYRHLANKMQQLGFFGAQAFFEKEAASELEHYAELRNFYNDMGDIAPTPALEAVTSEVTGIQGALQMAYDMEEYLLKEYEEYAMKSVGVDMAAFELFLRFVRKQVKSVGEFNDLISRLYKNPTDVFEFDEYLKNA